MRIVTVFAASLLTLSACSSPDPVPPTPYLSVPIADVDPETQLGVHGKGMTWTRIYSDQEYGIRTDGPKLQRFLTPKATDPDNLFVAVFRNFDTEVYYGQSTFILPPGTGALEDRTVSGTTDLLYDCTIARNLETLTYTFCRYVVTRGTFPLTSQVWEEGDVYEQGSTRNSTQVTDTSTR